MAKTNYEVVSTGECMSTKNTFCAATDTGAKRMARAYHNPHQSNWSWHGHTILTNLTTGQSWMLEAGNESKGWQNHEE